MTLKSIKELRSRTGAGMDSCRSALAETGDDIELAIEVLKKRGVIKAADRAGRIATEGRVFSYAHSNKIVSAVEINCETDFAAKSDAFVEFGNLVLMQITASSPLALIDQEIPQDVRLSQQRMFLEQIPRDAPMERKEKILSGKMEKWYSEVCLLEQESVAVPGKTIEQLRVELVAKLGENVNIRRFFRWELGEGLLNND